VESYRYGSENCQTFKSEIFHHSDLAAERAPIREENSRKLYIVGWKERSEVEEKPEIRVM